MDRYEANCETGEIAVIPLTNEEMAAHEQDVAAIAETERARVAAVAAAEAQRQADAQTIMAVLPNQAAKDAMARLLGLA